jgi:hypothetical protein
MTMRTSVSSWSSRAPRADTSQPADVAYLRVSQLAAAIEGDPCRVEEWYRSVRILELGAMTAQELVMQDHADLLMGFLRSILRGERD